MCFSKKKGQKKDPQSVPANTHAPKNRKMSLRLSLKGVREPAIDIPKELDFLKSNYYQNSFLKSPDKQKNPESKTENPTSDNIEVQQQVSDKNHLIPAQLGNSGSLFTFQAKSDSIPASRKMSEMLEGGSMEKNETPRSYMEKIGQPKFDKNANISEEVFDSIRPPRMITSGAKGETLAMAITPRNEYFLTTNRVILIAL